jgi:DNA-directed RNA polymerase subunit RPC12/RpoP
MGKFVKNDQGFVCVNCGATVEPFKVTSRDHCNCCLVGLHVDVNPGDRANTCRGVLRPVGVKVDSRKGYVIMYRCDTCGRAVNNKAAGDDNFEEILKVSKGGDK